MNFRDLFDGKHWLTAVNWIGWPILGVYLFAMYIWPIFSEAGDLEAIQVVWDRWQGLNIGFLAFVSSLIAFNISRYNAEQTRKREFVAARAFLPEALSELTSYCRASMTVFTDAYAEARAVDPADRRRTPLETTVPDLPADYARIFQECIKTADAEVAEKLADILMKLQIHDSRMRGLVEDFEPQSNAVITAHRIISHLYDIGELQALVNKLFKFARDMELFDTAPLVDKDFHNAYFPSSLEVTEYDGLKEFIKRKIAGEGDSGDV